MMGEWEDDEEGGERNETHGIRVEACIATGSL